MSRNRTNNRSRNVVTTINNKPKLTRVFRLKGTPTSGATFLRSDLLSLLIAVTSGSTAFISLIDAIKINSVRITWLPDDDADASECCLAWVGDRAPDTCLTTLVTNAIPAITNSRPPKDSLASFWSTQSGDTSESLFSVTCPLKVEAILDIQVVMVFGDNTTSTGVLSSAASFNGIAAPWLPQAYQAFTAVGLTTLGTT